MVRFALCVMVPVYPLMVSEPTLNAVSITAGAEPVSKITSVLASGIEALLAPPDVADQLVFPVALQFEDEPPPTQ
jgi:hypothetical protein